MITLPKFPRPNRMAVDVLDFGLNQRGASTTRVDRPGGRHRLTFGWPREVMRPPHTSHFLSRLKRGKRQGVELELPLPQPQPSAGSPVVDGAGQSGTTLAVRGLTPHYTIYEDFWLTVIEADGTAYLHSVFETVRANAAGEATIEIEPPLRAPFTDGDSVEIARPFIQGIIAAETLSYAFEELRQVPLTITIEETK